MSNNIVTQEESQYKGYKELSGDTEFINQLLNDISQGINDYGFVVNEYLSVHNSDLDEEYDYRFDGRKFIELKKPSLSKVIKPLNKPQLFALDLLNNKNIPIKIIAGGFGTGKTKLSVKTGLDLVVSKEIYKTLIFLRNPIVADSTDIGFLPGTKEEKIYSFCRPFLQYIENPELSSFKSKNKNKHKEKDEEQFYLEDEYAEYLIRQGKIKMDVISYLKGVSLDDSYVIMDEAEDLNTKLIKLVGSRIGEKSCIVFLGDWKQAENKYKSDNGLLTLINKGRGDPLVGIVVLDEDVRSPTSKFFANL